MAVSSRNVSPGPLPIRNRYACLALIAVGILVRIPFLGAFDLVAYDGTYYIDQAESILAGGYHSSVFPVGYPAFIALFIPFLRNSVRAAQAVSFLSGIGSLIVFYSLGRHFLRRSYALTAGLVLALTPLFIRLSMMTMSESIYIFWVLLGFLLFAKGRELLSGLSMGMAAITRPEALGVFLVLCILRLRRPKRLVVILAGFIIVYSANVAYQSVAAGRFVLEPKKRAFGASARQWEYRESWIDFDGKERVLETIGGERGKFSLLLAYIERLPEDALLLVKHVTPVVLLLALYGIYRKRLFLLASFVPLLVLPAVTARSEPRFILPYIPGFILYSMIGLEGVRKRRISVILLVLLMLSAASGIAVNRDRLAHPVSDGFQWAKQVGISFRDRVGPGDRIADRKPYFAFYAGGEYVEIPVAPYDETVGYLAENDVKYLVLHHRTISTLRPLLLPLISDWTVMNGELRYSQVLFEPGLFIYEKRMNSDPLERRRLVQLHDKIIYGPAWSPDGGRIAFRVLDAPGSGGIYSVPVKGGEAGLIIAGSGAVDPVSWAPDSKRIAFAGDIGGNMDIFVYRGEGEPERITTNEGEDMSPSWSGDGREIVFSSNRSGQSEIWVKNLETGELTQVTTEGGYGYPSISPDGRRIACVREGEGLYIHDRRTGTVVCPEAPKHVNFTPAWSPDGEFIAVTGRDWGNTDVYLVTTDGKNAALLTKTVRIEGEPAWSTDGNAIATVSVRENVMELWILTGIEPYKDRLMSPVKRRRALP